MRQLQASVEEERALGPQWRQACGSTPTPEAKPKPKPDYAVSRPRRRDRRVWRRTECYTRATCPLEARSSLCARLPPQQRTGRRGGRR